MWPPSHGAGETNPVIYGPCGVMACTLGIFYYLKLIFKVAVRICAGPSSSFADGIFFSLHGTRGHGVASMYLSSIHPDCSFLPSNSLPDD
jgi:D-serine dehydratase